jgi:hypothetical protein
LQQYLCLINVLANYLQQAGPNIARQILVISVEVDMLEAIPLALLNIDLKGAATKLQLQIKQLIYTKFT